MSRDSIVLVVTDFWNKFSAAVEAGNLEYIQSLINESESKGDVLILLMMKRPAISTCYEDQIVKAACFGFSQIVEYLINKSYQHNVFEELVGFDIYGCALVEATSNGHFQTVRFLIDNLVQRGEFRDFEEGYDYLVVKAARRGFSQIVEYLINKSYQHNVFEELVGVDTYGNALVEAASNGHFQVVRFLIDNLVQRDEFRQFEETNNHIIYAIEGARDSGHFNIFQFLVTNSVRQGDPDLIDSDSSNIVPDMMELTLQRVRISDRIIAEVERKTRDFIRNFEGQNPDLSIEDETKNNIVDLCKFLTGCFLLNMKEAISRIDTSLEIAKKIISGKQVGDVELALQGQQIANMIVGLKAGYVETGVEIGDISRGRIISEWANGFLQDNSILSFSVPKTEVVEAVKGLLIGSRKYLQDDNRKRNFEAIERGLIDNFEKELSLIINTSFFESFHEYRQEQGIEIYSSSKYENSKNYLVDRMEGLAQRVVVEEKGAKRDNPDTSVNPQQLKKAKREAVKERCD